MRHIALCSLLPLLGLLGACAPAGDSEEETTNEAAVSAAARLETVPATEAAQVQKIAEIITNEVKKTQAETDGVARRDQHAKHHGCVTAKLEVNANLPPAMRSSLFRPGKIYDSWVRLSNGAGKVADDHDGDARGFAIKILNVDAQTIMGPKTHDLIFINKPALPFANVAEYFDFFSLVGQGKSPARYFVPGFNPFNWRIREALIARSIRNAKIASPLESRYFSVTPYLYKDRAVKFGLTPCAEIPEVGELPASPDYLREALKAKLDQGSACFELSVQTQVDARSMPVEDPTVTWDEDDAPFQKIATLTIAKQDFSSPNQMKFCENLSYTPWHATLDHRPLGGINRARRMVYETISTLRHGLNGAARTEPTDLSVPAQ